MSTKGAKALGLPPGLNFCPDDDELVEFFLLPTVRGEPAWFPGVVVIDDDSAANTLPWKLLERHGLAGDDEAYFFVRTKEAARQDRHCADGARWVSQRPVFGASCIGGETVEWRRINLNLQMGRGKSGGGSGSTGWVMHEYTLTEPACPSLKICHVSFSGHGKDRKRVPDEKYSSDCRQTAEPASKRARVDAANSGSSTCVYGSTAPTIDQGYGADASAGDVFLQQTGEPWCYSGVFSVPDGHNDYPAGDPSVVHASAGQQEHSPPPFMIGIQSISATDQQQQLLPDDNNAANDSSSATTCAYDYEPVQATDEEIMDWGSSFLADDAEPIAEQQETDEHALTPQLMIQETVAAGAAESSDGISQTNQQQQLDSSDQDPSVAYASASQQEDSPPFPIDQGISATANSSSASCAYDYEPMQATDEEILDWGSLLADDAEPTAEQQKTDEHAMTPQLMIQESAAGAAGAAESYVISPTSQQQLDSVPFMEVEERQEIQEDQLQLVQSSTTAPFAESAGAELYLEQGVPTIEQHLLAEYQNGGDDRQEQREFWMSIGVDIENMVF